MLPQQMVESLWSALQSLPVLPGTLLLREACYRAVGEGFAHVSQHIDFTAWYASELQSLLEKGYAVSGPLPPCPALS